MCKFGSLASSRGIDRRLPQRGVVSLRKTATRRNAWRMRAGATFILSLMLATPAVAHRFGGPNDPCERKLGTSLIHITLFQPQYDPDAEYCDDIPRAGNTVFV